MFARKSIGQIADHFEAVITTLDQKPAVLGHSFGGLLTQILAGRGLSAASVAIDPAPFRGVLPLPISALRSASPVLRNPANRHRAVPLTYEQFRYAFANAVDEDEAKSLYEGFAVSGSGEPIFQAAAANLNPWSEAKVDSKNPDRGPLLVISGELDHTVPWAIANASYKQREAQPGRDGDRGDQGPWSLAHDRQWLAGGRRHGPRVRQALRLGRPRRGRRPLRLAVTPMLLSRAVGRRRRSVLDRRRSLRWRRRRVWRGRRRRRRHRVRDSGVQRLAVDVREQGGRGCGLRHHGRRDRRRRGDGDHDGGQRGEGCGWRGRGSVARTSRQDAQGHRGRPQAHPAPSSCSEYADHPTSLAPPGRSTSARQRRGRAP